MMTSWTTDIKASKWLISTSETVCFFSGEMNGMVYILNTRYEIFYRHRKDDVELEDADSYVDFYNKKCICQLKTDQLRNWKLINYSLSESVI